MGTAIRPLGMEDAEAAFALATRVFVAESALHRALGFGLEEYRAYMRGDFMGMAEAGMSVGAWEGEALVGCLMVMPFEAGDAPTGTGRRAAIPALLHALRAGYDREAGDGRVALADMGAVAEAAAGRGVYRALRLAGQERARAAGYTRILGELSSAATQHVVLDAMGHRRVAEVAYADFEMADGSRPFAGIAEPRSIVLSEGAL